MSNDYTYWTNALAMGAVALANDREHRVTTDPMPGFYRDRRNRPVAIWYDDDGFNLTVGGEPIHESLTEQTWLSVCRRPVSEQAYRDYLATGRWADVDPVVSETIGHNIGNAADPEALAALLTQLQDASTDYVKVSSDEESKRAHGIRARINELKLRCSNLHKVEKEPHLKAGQAVDRKWNPIIKDADQAASRLGRAMASWEDEKAMALRRRAREEEEARAAAAAAAKAGQPAPPPPPPVEPLPEPTDTIRSGYGRAASVRTKMFVTAITDVDALFNRYRDHEDVLACLTKLAQKAVDRGLEVPGVRVEEKAVVR